MALDKVLFEEVVLALELRERIVEDGGVMPSFADVDAMPQPDFSDVGGVIGVVLPLSGRFAKYGEQSLNGIIAAAKIFGFEPEVVTDAPSDLSEDLRGSLDGKRKRVSSVW